MSARYTTTATRKQRQWRDEVIALADQVRTWAEQVPGWRITDEQEKILRTQPLPQSNDTAPMFAIETPSGRLVFEPFLRGFENDGFVEFYAWPSLFRVFFLQAIDDERGPWLVKTDSGIALRQLWNRDNSIALCNDLLAAGA